MNRISPFSAGKPAHETSRRDSKDGKVASTDTDRKHAWSDPSSRAASRTLPERHPRVGQPGPDVPAARAHPPEPLVVGTVSVRHRHGFSLTAGAMTGLAVGLAIGIPTAGPFGVAAGMAGFILGGAAALYREVRADRRAEQDERMKLEHARADFARLHGHQELPALSPREQLERVVQLANQEPLKDGGLHEAIDQMRSIHQIGVDNPTAEGRVTGNDLAQAVARLARRARFFPQGQGFSSIPLNALTALAREGRCTWTERAKALALMAGQISRDSYPDRVAGESLAASLAQAPRNSVPPEVQWSCRREIMRALPSSRLYQRLLEDSRGSPARLERLNQLLRASDFMMEREDFQRALAAAREETQRAMPPDATAVQRAQSYLRAVVDLARSGRLGDDALALALEQFNTREARICFLPSERRDMVVELFGGLRQPVNPHQMQSLARCVRSMHAPDRQEAAVAELYQALLTKAQDTPRRARFTLDAVIALHAARVPRWSTALGEAIRSEADRLTPRFADTLRELLGRTDRSTRAVIYVEIADMLRGKNVPQGVLSAGLLSPREVMDMVGALADGGREDRPHLMARLMQLTQAQTTREQLEYTLRRLANLPEFSHPLDVKGAQASMDPEDEFSKIAASAISYAGSYISRADAEHQARVDQKQSPRTAGQTAAVSRTRVMPLPLPWLESPKRLIEQAWAQRGEGIGR